MTPGRSGVRICTRSSGRGSPTATGPGRHAVEQPDHGPVRLGRVLRPGGPRPGRVGPAAGRQSRKTTTSRRSTPEIAPASARAPACSCSADSTSASSPARGCAQTATSRQESAGPAGTRTSWSVTSRPVTVLPVGRHPGPGQLVEGVLRGGLGRVHRLHLRHLAQVHPQPLGPQRVQRGEEAHQLAQRVPAPVRRADPQPQPAPLGRVLQRRRRRQLDVEQREVGPLGRPGDPDQRVVGELPLPVRRADHHVEHPVRRVHRGQPARSSRPSAGSPGTGWPLGSRIRAAADEPVRLRRVAEDQERRRPADRGAAQHAEQVDRLPLLPVRLARRRLAVPDVPPAPCAAGRGAGTAPSSPPGRRRSGRPASRARPGPPRRTGTRCGRAAAPPRSATGTRPTAARRTRGGRPSGRSPA